MTPERSNVVLIGARGCGKTTIGRELAHRLHRPFVDIDGEVERRTSRTVRTIFAEDGEPAFRALESAVIAEVAAGANQVISVGGGAVLAARNRALLRGAGVCVWLTAPAEELAQRLAADPRTAALRPALTGLPPADELRHLLAQRSPLYAELADHTVSTAGRAVADVVASVLACLAQPPPAV